MINVSLVGPRNPLVERAVAQALARGVQIVAAVGNDGPAAPPLYPAAYPGVIAAPVDRRDRILPEAGRGPHADFAAPGSDMAAAAANGRWVTVRGASFAAPLVAGLLAQGASPETLSRQAQGAASGGLNSNLSANRGGVSSSADGSGSTAGAALGEGQLVRPDAGQAQGSASGSGSASVSTSASRDGASIGLSGQGSSQASGSAQRPR